MKALGFFKALQVMLMADKFGNHSQEHISYQHLNMHRILLFSLKYPSVTYIPLLLHFGVVFSPFPHLLFTSQFTAISLALPPFPYFHQGILLNLILLDFSREFGGIDNSFLNTSFSNFQTSHSLGLIT